MQSSTAITRGPTDRDTVQSVLKSDLKRAVAQFGEAWFLSVRNFWPACSEHGDFIDAVEERAMAANLAQPVEPTVAAARKSFSVVEVPKVAVFDAGSDAIAWLEQVENVCSVANFAKPAWCAFATASLDKVPLNCWIAHKRQVSEETLTLICGTGTASRTGAVQT